MSPGEMIIDLCKAILALVATGIVLKAILTVAH